MMTPDLFGDAPTERLEFEDLYSVYLRERHGLPDGWRWFDMSAMPGDAPEGWARVGGAVSPGRLGPASWKKRDRNTERTLFLDLAEFSAWKAARERATGVCQECSGHGKQIASVGVGGTSYRACRHCQGTGVSPDSDSPTSSVGGER